MLINEDMPLAFGNFGRGFIIVDKLGSRFLRDPYTKAGWIRLYVWRRVHGHVTDSNAIKLLKIAMS